MPARTPVLSLTLDVHALAIGVYAVALSPAGLCISLLLWSSEARQRDGQFLWPATGVRNTGCSQCNPPTQYVASPSSRIAQHMRGSDNCSGSPAAMCMQHRPPVPRGLCGLQAALGQLQEGAAPHDPAIMVRYRDGDRSRWQLQAAWIATDQKSKLRVKPEELLVSQLDHDSTEWSTPIKVQLHGNIKLLRATWVSDDMMPNSLLLVNVQSLDKNKAVSTLHVHTMDEFDGFKAPLKKEKGWSHNQGVKDLAGFHLQSPPVRGLQGEWLLPV
ncbi:uncharacterized protein LOC142355559 [Convolutriloba macropyga]|uniref:uncharacterized protein LOC142355559 n=1 Tax=Convolutriloba macropyga TaxID=536237 RepID=UPI003F5230D4